MLQNSLVSTYPNQTVCNLRTRKFQQILPVNRDKLRSPFGLWSSKPHRLLQLHTSIASPLPMSLRYPYLISRQTLSILVVATFVIIVSHQRAQRGLGGIRWWLLVRVVTIWRLLLLGCRLSFRINLCFLGLRLHRNYYIFQERRLAPLRRWLRPALLWSRDCRSLKFMDNIGSGSHSLMETAQLFRFFIGHLLFIFPPWVHRGNMKQGTKMLQIKLIYLWPNMLTSDIFMYSYSKCVLTMKIIIGLTKN